MYEEIVYQMALPLQNLGNLKIKALLQHFGAASSIFQQYESLKNRKESRNFLPSLSLTSEMLAQIEMERNRMEKEGINFCFFTDSGFPKRLKSCDDASYYFFYKGGSYFQFPKSVAVVGTRNASSYGKECVKKILSDVANSDIFIVSGLAKGIDTMAHQTALECELKTVAVMGTGFGRIYPAGNQQLSERILENGGTLITEFFHHVNPDRHNFPIRNKTIAGLSDATIVVETARRGGSMITAMLSHSYNRDVFAVPGNIFHKNYEGCHYLIHKNLAAMICSGEQLLEMMNWDVEQKRVVQREIFCELDENEQRIVTFIDEKEEAHIDDIIEHLNGHSVSLITSFLLNLEFKGVIKCKPGKVYQVV